ncbi:choice-of-anchor B family protein [Constantimarinum furrinae]|uniref:Regulator n=1 Tax=Constantimarinum furrinae TaxID=2562285 RepID=A0A7G8PSL5_9FLAO|nr:choice-of-anchor B family protein [Constantimarinum furrinae]QNJ97331.1 regulator [Constantimarinum furrinae]
MKKILLIFALSCFIFSCNKDDNAPDPMEQNTDDGDIPDPDPDPVMIPVSAICDNGMAGVFPCNNYDLIYRIGLDEFGASEGNDIWGWTDPSSGKEYALMGLDNGTAFVDISNAANPVYLGKLRTQTGNSAWRDIKVYNNYAFVVSEASNHGMQVFDLTRLRNVANPPTSFNADAIYTGFGSAHNIVINTNSGYAYAVGSDTFNGGPHFINIQDPLNPVGEGGYSMDSYSHDAQVVTYTGPDSDYTGREILIGSNENEVVIVDITDKNNPVHISAITYQQTGYTHQGWFTDDQSYFLLGDELDEINFGINSRTILFDFSDLDDPQTVGEYYGPTTAIDHNGYVKGNTFFQANYTAGVRIISLADINNGNLQEIGFFDTHPSNNAASFNGAWSVYPFFNSEHIIVSDINMGLFIIKKKT